MFLLILKLGVDLGSDVDFVMYFFLLNNDNEKLYFRDWIFLDEEIL